MINFFYSFNSPNFRFLVFFSDTHERGCGLRNAEVCLACFGLFAALLLFAAVGLRLGGLIALLSSLGSVNKSLAHESLLASGRK